MKRNTRTMLATHSVFTARHTQYKGYHIEHAVYDGLNLYTIFAGTQAIKRTRKLADAKNYIDSVRAR